MIEITAKKNFDLGKMVRAIPKETATLLNDIADAAIMDIREGVDKSVDISGIGFKGLKKATIKAKERRGYPHPQKPLLASGKMVGVGAGGSRRGIYVKSRATAKKLLAIVTTAAATPWAVYHQKGDPPQPQREWFGISKRMPKKVDKLIKAAEGRIVRAGDTGGMR